MKVTVCQLDNRPGRLETMLADLAAHVSREQSQFLLLPEMCFHEWLAADAGADAARWQAAVADHERQIENLAALGVKAVIGTRPLIDRHGQRRNQAYLWTRDGVSAVHDKYYLPDEAGYREASWYQRGELRFDPCYTLGLCIGVQICTEMWFFEWARHFARLGADLLCVPRATPHGSLEKWIAGGQAAAVCSGAWCLSSNIWNPPGSKADCGGLGWIISPEGDVLGKTAEDAPFVSLDIDVDFARQSKETYPRYVTE